MNVAVKPGFRAQFVNPICVYAMVVGVATFFQYASVYLEDARKEQERQERNQPHQQAVRKESKQQEKIESKPAGAVSPSTLPEPVAPNTESSTPSVVQDENSNSQLSETANRQSEEAIKSTAQPDHLEAQQQSEAANTQNAQAESEEDRQRRMDRIRSIKSRLERVRERIKMDTECAERKEAQDPRVGAPDRGGNLEREDIVEQQKIEQEILKELEELNAVGDTNSSAQ